MRKLIWVRFLPSAFCLLLAAFCLLPSALRAQGGAGQQLCGADILAFGSTVHIPTSRQNCFQITLTGNVNTSFLDFPYTGEWIYLTVRQDSTGGRSFTPPYNTLNWQPIDTRPYSDTPGATQGITTEMGYFDGNYWQIVGGYSSSSPGGCLPGASDTQYVDSASGLDSNTGLNWCSAKLTEAAAVTALGAGGGWIYVAPNYTGAAASGVPANVHILQTNQFDALGSSARRFSFPDWSDTTEDHHSFFSANSSTPADANAAFLALGPFSASNMFSSVTGTVTIPASATASSSEMAGVAGFATANGSGANLQAEGVYGNCYDNLATGQDCSGVVGVAGNSATATGGYIEGMWSNVSLASTPTGAFGIVLRATGGHMPTGTATPDGYGIAAVDVRNSSPGGPSAGNTWPTGIYLEDWTVTQPLYLGLNDPHPSDRGNDGILFAYQYNAGTEETSQFRVTGSANVLFPFGGDFQFVNKHANGTASTATVTVQTNATGNVSVDAINTVSFSATPTFDRSLGKVQKITLTANVTGSTLSNCLAGQTVIFDIVENGTGGFTFSAPANLHGFGSITTTAGEHNRQEFYCDGSSSNSGGWSVSAMQSGT